MLHILWNILALAFGVHMVCVSLFFIYFAFRAQLQLGYPTDVAEWILLICVAFCPIVNALILFHLFAEWPGRAIKRLWKRERD